MNGKIILGLMLLVALTQATVAARNLSNVQNRRKVKQIPDQICIFQTSTVRYSINHTFRRMMLTNQQICEHWGMCSYVYIYSDVESHQFWAFVLGLGTILEERRPCEYIIYLPKNTIIWNIDQIWDQLAPLAAAGNDISFMYMHKRDVFVIKNTKTSLYIQRQLLQYYEPFTDHVYFQQTFLSEIENHLDEIDRFRKHGIINNDLALVQWSSAQAITHCEDLPQRPFIVFHFKYEPITLYNLEYFLRLNCSGHVVSDNVEERLHEWVNSERFTHVEYFDGWQTNSFQERLDYMLQTWRYKTLSSEVLAHDVDKILQEASRYEMNDSTGGNE